RVHRPHRGRRRAPADAVRPEVPDGQGAGPAGRGRRLGGAEAHAEVHPRLAALPVPRRPRLRAQPLPRRRRMAGRKRRLCEAAGWVADDDIGSRGLASALTSWAGGWSGSNQAPGPDGRFSGPKGAGRLVLKGTTIDLVLADDGATADRISAALG